MLLQFRNGMARTADRPFKGEQWIGIPLVKMNATQAKLPSQIEMVVQNNPRIIRRGDIIQQHLNRFPVCVRLS